MLPHSLVVFEQKYASAFVRNSATQKGEASDPAEDALDVDPTAPFSLPAAASPGLVPPLDRLLRSNHNTTRDMMPALAPAATMVPRQASPMRRERTMP
mmetsp:Transcript_17842/g.49496  ORF Transcript_17842/g.49496 Transcript_17842/m.49496 type:complete len:98 (+) Transcript_17842:573-866(+)